MANIELEKEYKCRDDCMPQGCPGHTMVMFLNTTSMGIYFLDEKNKNTNQLHANYNAWKAIIELIQQVQEYRADVNLIENCDVWYKNKKQDLENLDKELAS